MYRIHLVRPVKASPPAEAKRSEGLQNDAWLRLELALEILKGVTRDLDNGTSKVSDIENAKSASHSAIIARVGAA